MSDAESSESRPEEDPAGPEGVTAAPSAPTTAGKKPDWDWVTLAGHASTLVLGALLVTFVGAFLVSNWPMLTDVRLQNDDARTSLFPLHRYGPAHALGDDPIASEMLGFLPLGVRLLYQAIVPFTDIYLAAKVVQAVAFAIVVWAAVVLSRGRRTGVAAGVLLVFLMLHDWYAVNRIAGGLPRAFGFPCFALWLSGVLAQNRRVRFTAPVLAALTYPSVMNMILAAEGLMALRGAFRVPWSVILRRLKRYAIVVGLCFVAALPAVVGGSERGPIYTLEEAQHEPAFGRNGRLWILPFAEPTSAMSNAFVDAFTPRGGTPIPRLKAAFEKDPKMYALVLLGLVLCVPLLRLSPPPSSAVAFVVGSVVLYWLSRWLAFRLYSPERYYSFGMRMAATALVMACLAHAFYWLRPRLRTPARNALVSVAMFGIWAGTGNGNVRNNGMVIDSRNDADLYEFVRTLPKNARFAGHLLDTDGIPYYGARATMGGFETLQPWFKDSWARQKQRMNETLSALYSSDKGEVLAYAERNHVTHFLINRHRYGAGLRKNYGSFQPFHDYTRQLLYQKKPRDLVFNSPPKSAIVFRTGRWLVVSVDELEKAWSKP